MAGAQRTWTLAWKPGSLARPAGRPLPNPLPTSAGTFPPGGQLPGSGIFEEPHTLMNTFCPCSLWVFTTNLQMLSGGMGAQGVGSKLHGTRGCVGWVPSQAGVGAGSMAAVVL